MEDENIITAYNNGRMDRRAGIPVTKLMYSCKDKAYQLKLNTAYVKGWWNQDQEIQEEFKRSGRRPPGRPRGPNYTGRNL